MHTLGRIIGVGAIAAAAFTLAACGSDDKDTAVTTTTAGTGAVAQAKHGRECTAEDIGVTGGFGETPRVTIPGDCDPPTKLITKDLVEGSGPGAVAGQPLTMNYVLVTWSDKKKLDSSFDRGKPFQLNLGAGEVIPGWDQGLVGVQQGARRLLIIPPNLGYGAGSGGIKPNETLVFVTDAVGVGN
ncbi:FKBP-type peptidyl-prolyl cis-trans isomerase [Nocardia xishanensis]|uniref:FKBP-type peptidyl-prolyl cis-trans isomerase n=1 Tax=Nocardia xishanensis TaxID=238964 RepID=UPI00082F6E75|nr:FKBP-type peptidyl-prolyl cis-trans isomerase [Nocardia xishanensis]